MGGKTKLVEGVGVADPLDRLDIRPSQNIPSIILITEMSPATDMVQLLIMVTMMMMMMRMIITMKRNPVTVMTTRSTLLAMLIMKKTITMMMRTKVMKRDLNASGDVVALAVAVTDLRLRDRHTVVAPATTVQAMVTVVTPMDPATAILLVIRQVIAADLILVGQAVTPVLEVLARQGQERGNQTVGAVMERKTEPCSTLPRKKCCNILQKSCKHLYGRQQAL